MSPFDKDAQFLKSNAAAMRALAGGKEHQGEERPRHQVRSAQSQGSFFHVERGKLPDG